MKARTVTLTPEEQAHLQAVARRPTSAKRDAFRAGVILRVAAGGTNEAIAAAAFSAIGWMGCGMRRVAENPPAMAGRRNGAFWCSWIIRCRQGLPAGTAACWRRRCPTSLRIKFGECCASMASRCSAAADWCVSTDPCFAQKAADIVGLYLHPPENALGLAGDEKPHIQALERAQGWLKLPNGKALTGFSHDYQRHGNTTLFAALEVTTGLVKGGHYRRRRRVEFLDFMNRLLAQHPEREIHVILDNLNTHKPKCDRWLARHSQVHLHFTPTHASWMNQVEIWFSILQRHSLAGSSFTSPQQLRNHIDDFIAAYNQSAHPFEWSKQTVFQKRPKISYSNLCN